MKRFENINNPGDEKIIAYADALNLPGEGLGIIALSDDNGDPDPDAVRIFVTTEVIRIEYKDQHIIMPIDKNICVLADEGLERLHVQHHINQKRN